MMGMKKVPAAAADKDRASELPQPLLHHILSFLSQKESVQTCILSKSWRCLGSTRPNLEFLHKNHNEQNFLSILDKNLQSYHDQKLSIQEFHVEIRSTDPESAPFLKKWFPFIVAMMGGVKTFDLSYSRFSKLGYCDLPSEVFENSKSLRKLRLCGFLFSQDFPKHYKVHYNLKHLQTLTLENVHILDETFHNIMSSCRYIEHVVLHGCNGMTTIRLMNNSCLKSFDLVCSHEYRLKEDLCFIDVPNLETMKIKKANVWFNFDRLHRNMYFPGLKSLYLMELKLPTRPSLDILSRDFPCLQQFHITYCRGFGELRVSNRSILYLTISCLISSIVVDAPNIQELNYSGLLPPDISFATTSNDCVSTIKPSGVDSEEGFLRLSKLLKAVSQSKITLKIPQDDCSDYDSSSDEDDNNGNDYHGIFTYGYNKPVQVEYLHLSGHGYFYSEAFLNRMIRYFHPRNILEGKCTGRSRFLCKMLLLRKKKGSHYYWLRDLEEASMELWDHNSKEWQSVEGITFIESGAQLRLPSNEYTNHHEVWFKLKWRE